MLDFLNFHFSKYKEYNKNKKLGIKLGIGCVTKHYFTLVPVKFICVSYKWKDKKVKEEIKKYKLWFDLARLVI